MKALSALNSTFPSLPQDGTTMHSLPCLLSDLSDAFLHKHLYTCTCSSSINGTKVYMSRETCLCTPTYHIPLHSTFTEGPAQTGGNPCPLRPEVQELSLHLHLGHALGAE